MTENRAPAEIISIASGKGGTGKTLLLASLAYALRRAGHQVLVVDFDLATEGLSHFVLGDDGVRRIAEFRTENTVSGFIQNFETDIGTVPLLEPRTINRGTDQEIIYEAVISGRGLYGDIADAVEAKDTAQKGTDDNTRAAVKAIFERLRPMPYDYILIDTRGGFSLLTTYVCALSHSYILVTEPTTASLYQNRKLQDRILDEAEQDKLRPVLRGAIVNKAVRDVEPKLDNDGQLVFDADEIERRFRGDLAQELGTEVHNTYGIPSDLAAVETYAFQRIPFSHARGSLFSLTTIDAFSGLMGTVTVEWDVKRLNMWNSLVKEMRAATVKAYADAAAEFENQVTSRASDKSQAALVRQSHEHAQKRRNAVIQTGIASLIVGWVVLLFALSAGLLPASTTQIINNWTGGATYAD